MGDPFARVRHTKRRDTADSLEIQRIVRLAVVELPTPEEVEAVSREEVDARYFEHGFRLRNVQVGALLAWDLYQGGLMPIGVGWGKTLISLMIAQRAFERDGIERSALFVPPQVYEQLTTTDIFWARKRVRLTVPFVLMGGRSRASRLAAARSGKRGCYILPYSLLSTRDSEDLLEAVAPGLLIFDEAHKIKSVKAARTVRTRRFMAKAQPRVVALSGTMTSKSVSDYHHVAVHALRENCPLPMDSALAANWGMVLDAKADPSAAQTGPLLPLIAWAKREFPQESLPSGVPGFRKAYRLRLNTTPGVVATGDDELGVSLNLHNRPIAKPEEHPDYEAMKRLMDDVEELWRTPSGDEIEEGFHKWRYLYELSSGFYYRLRWPEPEEIVQRQHLTLDEARVYLEMAKAHHEARQEYHRTLRRWLGQRGRRGLDTPLLVANDMAHHGDKNVGKLLYQRWRESKDLEFEGMPERISEPVRVCDYKIRHAVAWAEELQARKRGVKGGLIWYHHNALGQWLHEALIAAGIDALWCPSESRHKGSNAAILDRSTADRIVVASINGHGTGKNLQFHENMLLLQFPRPADTLEQVLGRLHRPGQEADELIVHTCNTITFDHLNMAAALVDALYIHQTLGSKQKAIYATYDPMPRIYPPDFLRERGFADVQHLDAEARAALEERFGTLAGL